MRWLTLVLVALLAGGCYGRGAEPPRPTRTLVADSVDVATHWEYDACGDLDVTVRSGRVVEVVVAPAVDPGCSIKPVTPIVLGNRVELTEFSSKDGDWPAPDPGWPGPLVLTGSDGEQAWVGAVSSPTQNRECWSISFGPGEGAFLEGETLHFTSGLVLPLAPDYEAPTYPKDPFPLRWGDGACANDKGEITSVGVWFPN